MTYVSLKLFLQFSVVAAENNSGALLSKWGQRERKKDFFRFGRLAFLRVLLITKEIVGL